MSPSNSCRLDWNLQSVKTNSPRRPGALTVLREQRSKNRLAMQFPR